MDEFTVRLASTSGKKHNVFKLHKDDNVTWADAKMRRENDHQPWQIKFGTGRTARRFKAIKEGGVGDNASYYVFYKANDKTYEAVPVDEWFSVSATQRYKTLTAEEAEQKFEQRHKMLNLFSVMHLKKNGENAEEGGPLSQGGKAFKVSELDDWDNSGDDFGSENEDVDSDDDKKKARRKKAIKKERDNPDDAPDEAKEDSDEGDFEQREVDYMSDSSSESSNGEEEKDRTEVKGIAEEEALRDLLSTDDEDGAENTQQKGSKNGDKTSFLAATGVQQDPDGSEDSSDSDDYDVDDEKMDSMFMKKGLPAKLPVDSEQPVPSSKQQPANKRKLAPDVTTASPQPAKRPCTSESSSTGEEKFVEEQIIKFLNRRPMTVRSILKDIKARLRRRGGSTQGLEGQDLVSLIASIIKRLPIDKQKINDETYLSLKS